MDRFRRLTFSTAWFLFFFFIIFYPQSLCSDNVADGHGGQNNAETNEDEKPSTFVMLTDTLALLSRSQISTWNKVKSFLNQLQLHFSPPNLDFRGRDIGQSRMGEGDGPGGRMKEAAEESAKSAVAAVDESAKSAAKVVGEAVQMTAEMVKETVSSNQESEAEL
ncbi:hypothetical protein PVL29_027057 [Vitis rotundifolia]|uniref:Transmembrane protein n=1 Tax=Vitis rotundifolia TaxID=103349 RepID=A0AA39D4Y5_VITRO|nr:hypothetical protein PVL29_027057 [Vitis rotundifolia]